MVSFQDLNKCLNLNIRSFEPVSKLKIAAIIATYTLTRYFKMQIIKAETIIHKTAKVDGKSWLVFAKVVDFGITVEQQGFMFYSKKDALAFIEAN